MKKWSYYNDSDPRVCAWARELIRAGLVPDGEVDERSITDVKSDDLKEFTQCHFFCGILGWPLALRLAGWPEDRPVWSGSCPCPPFSAAGKKKTCPECGGKPIPHPLKTGIFACVPCGYEWLADERHLWPEFLRIISGARPSVVFGEQVAGADGCIWLAGVRATMERIAYDFGASDLCAASVKSPNIRQRLFWVADANGGCQGNGELQRSGEYGQQPEDGGVGGVGNTTHKRRNAVGNDDDASERSTIALGVASSDGCRLGDTVEQGLEGHAGNESDGAKSGRIETIQARPTAQASRPWDSFEWFPCTDGKSRRTKPGLQLLAHGVSGRVVRLRGYGNAINPYVAKEFIEAYIEAKNQIEEPELSL